MILETQKAAFLSDKEDDYNALKINKTQPIITQLYDYLQESLDEINILPIHLLLNNFPFKEKNKILQYQ